MPAARVSLRSLIYQGACISNHHHESSSVQLRHLFHLRCMSSQTYDLTPNEIQMRKDAKQMIYAAIRAVDPYVAVRNRLSMTSEDDTSKKSPTLVVQVERDATNTLKYNLSNYDEIQIFSFGKASAAMSIAAAEMAQQAASKVPIKIGGTVIIKDDHATPDEIETLQKSNISVREASHPVPDARSVSGAKEILQAASSAEERTLIIVCISGGGSALFCSPRDPLSLDDLMATNSALLASGMPIEKMNVIRKRLENGKGGRLAAAAYLILSYIVGDPLDLIASGPTVPDGSGWDEANEIVKEYGLGIGGDHELPSGVLELLQMGLDGGVDDTPKEDNPAFSVNESSSTKYTENVLVGNNYASVMAAADQAKRLGYHPVVHGTRVEGEALCVAGMYVAMAEMVTQQKGNNDDKSLYGIG
jgi:glycerate 2-kinase